MHCVDCGHSFSPMGVGQVRCKRCRVKHRRAYWRDHKRRARGRPTPRQTGRSEPQFLIRDVISDDVIWLNRSRTYYEWARLCGYHPHSVQVDMRRRGWKRDFRGDVIQAPCADCNEPTAFGALDDHRKCPECSEQLDVFDPVAVCREELAKRRDPALAALRDWREQTRRSA